MAALERCLWVLLWMPPNPVWGRAVGGSSLGQFLLYLQPLTLPCLGLEIKPGLLQSESTVSSCLTINPPASGGVPGGFQEGAAWLLWREPSAPE